MDNKARGFSRVAAAVLTRLIAACFLAWSLVTAWAWTINGVLEPATLDVDYYEMGAGGDLLLKRALMFDEQGRLVDFLNQDEP